MAAVKETVADKKNRARRVVTRLQRTYPDAHCALEHDSAWQLLVSTILSAQSTDETVNRVTRQLYRKYRKPADFLKVAVEELENDLRPTGFFRQKTKSVRGSCRMLVERFDGQVPDRMEDLLELPGVARKTANVVLGTWFDKNEGVVVDTHVGRIAHRLALTWTSKNAKDAVRIEQDLMTVIPRRHWTFFAHALIWHGRQVCRARKPDCDACSLVNLCPGAYPDHQPSRSKATRAATRR